MDPKHEALKRILQSHKDGLAGGHQDDHQDPEMAAKMAGVDPDEQEQAGEALHEGEKDGSDLAPTHKDGDVANGADDDSGDAVHPAHLAALHAMADGGGAGAGLHGMVADKAKARIASIMKHKHGK